MITGRDRGHGRILEDEDVDPFDMGMDLMEANRMPLRKIPDTVGIVKVVITSPKSAEKNLVDLSAHNYLNLIFLPRVVLLRSPHLLIRALPHLYYRRRSMIDSDC